MLSRGLCLLVVSIWMVVGVQADQGPLFELPAVYGLAQEAKTAAVGDLNGDGRDDVAITAWPSALYVFYQQPDGTLGAPVQLYAPWSPLGMAVGDINGDSRLDLAVGGSNGDILLYYQQEDGTLGLPGTCYGYGQVSSLVIGDFNGDGLMDIADTSATFPIVLVCLQASNGTFGLPTSHLLSGYNARSVCALDYNSDGIRDIACLVDGSVCFMAGLGGGSFADAIYLPATWAYDLAAGDITGDGRDDLVFTVPESLGYGNVTVIPQGADGLPSSPLSYPAYAYAQALALADLNKDGRTDVATVHSGYEAVSVLCQNEGGTLGEWIPYPAPYSSNYHCGGLAVGDLNSDGTPDLAIADMWNGLVVILHTPDDSGPDPDTTAPVCTAALSGTTGLEGWYTSPVTVTLSAEDEAGGSGLSGIFVTTDGTTWVSYSSPVVLSQQGTTTLGYYAEDNAGNRSPIQWATVKIDTSAPVLTVKPGMDSIWPPNGSVVQVPVSITASDTASGVASLHLAVQDEYGLVQPEMDVAPGSVVSLPLVALRNGRDKDGRVYTIVLTGIDAAGNSAKVSATVTVLASASDKPKKNK